MYKVGPFLLVKKEVRMVNQTQSILERFLHAVGFSVAFAVIAMAAGMFWAVENHILV